ncbi:thioesterase family protein [Paracoccaceae bacterium]|nr:thioesterase family protein [Paracoccaceae bacterium]
MYPFLRMAKELIKNRTTPKLPVDGVHVSHHICWPWDLDVFAELNNGRTLSLFDLGRYGLAQRTGLNDALRKHKWGLTTAGANVRYRHRIKIFERFEMRSKLVFWDEKFAYIEQVMLSRDGLCANHLLFRGGMVNKNGLVPMAEVAKALEHSGEPPVCPTWVADWIDSESKRPWPPSLAAK